MYDTVKSIQQNDELNQVNDKTIKKKNLKILKNEIFVKHLNAFSVSGAVAVCCSVFFYLYSLIENKIRYFFFFENSEEIIIFLQLFYILVIKSISYIHE